MIVVLLIFVMLSAWTVSEFREPNLRWLGVAGFLGGRVVFEDLRMNSQSED